MDGLNSRLKTTEEKLINWKTELKKITQNTVEK